MAEVLVGATRTRITADLRNLGVAEGDVVMVHAAVRKIGPIIGGVTTLVQSLLDAVGADGTLVAYVDWELGFDPQLDPRPGGIFRVSPNRVDIIRGTYLETVPHFKVTFTWGCEGVGHAVPAGSTVVEITLQPEGDGTRLRLMHRNLSAEQRELRDSGWSHYVARLKIAAEGGIPEPDPLAAPSIHHGWRERVLGARSPEDQQ